MRNYSIILDAKFKISSNLAATKCQKELFKSNQTPENARIELTQNSKEIGKHQLTQ